MSAANNGYMEIAEALIANGAVIDVKNDVSYGMDALSFFFELSLCHTGWGFGNQLRQE